MRLAIEAQTRYRRPWQLHYLPINFAIIRTFDTMKQGTLQNKQMYNGMNCLPTSHCAACLRVQDREGCCLEGVYNRRPQCDTKILRHVHPPRLIPVYHTAYAAKYNPRTVMSCCWLVVSGACHQCRLDSYLGTLSSFPPELYLFLAMLLLASFRFGS